MTHYFPDLLARTVPRYTSYPTAADFREEVGYGDMADRLAEVGDEPLSLYVHLPFCREICAYCGCNTGRANRDQRLQSYLHALETEIDLVSEALAKPGQVKRIAFGGGSPNALAPISFVRLVEELFIRFGSGSPLLSIELDPRSMSKDWYMVISSIGITRASLGVQTFSPGIQAAIGRIQPDAMIAETAHGLRAAGVSSLNFDLMYGLPGQSHRDLSDSILRTIELGADRIALFGYAHMPALLPRQRKIDADTLPGMAQRFEQAAIGRALFLEHGYRPVGFDHFALPDDPLARASARKTLRRNFQGFTDDDSRTLIGLGASAISQFEDAIIQNEKQPGRYRMLLGARRLPAQRGILLNAGMKARARIIEELLCYGNAQVDPVRMAHELATLAPLFDKNIVTLQDRRLALSPDGWPYARLVASAFDQYRAMGAGQFSRAV